MSFLHRHRWLTPYLLLAPGAAFLVLFFVVPLYYLAYTSLQEGTVQIGYTFSWAWDNYSDAFNTYREQFFRSLEYAGIATLAALLISYPLTYWIAFRGGRWKNLLLLFIIAPFFVTYLIRTLAWQSILFDDGFVLHAFQAIGLVADDGRLLATSTAVIAGITYNFLPFMALPLYVSLEQIDNSLIEAAKDLYASSTKAFLRVTLPLSMPGVIAGTLDVHPRRRRLHQRGALGTPRQAMIGNVIQSKFLEITDYGQGRRALRDPHDRHPAPHRRLHPRRRDGEARRMSVAPMLTLPTPPGEPARARVGVRPPPHDHPVRNPRARLPDVPDRGRDRLFVQRPGRALQLHVGGLHHQALGPSVRPPFLGDAVMASIKVGLIATLASVILGT